MAKKFIISLITVFLFLTMNGQQAQKIIDSLYHDYAEKNHCAATVYAIVDKNEILYSGHFGLSNIEKKYEADDQTAFRIASMTKSFVAVAILQLRDAGKINLDDPAEKYIPELKNVKYPTTDAAPLTVRNLLTHSAGFPEDNPWGDRQLAVSDEQMLQMFKKGISFSNDPGMAYEYSNMGFAMLGYIIKKVTGTRYEDYIAEKIFRPLGMTHTYFEYADVPEKQLAIGYRYLNGDFVAQPMLHDGAYGAMGGLITTLADFRKYVAFHLSAWPPNDAPETGPLKRSSLREMQKPWQFSTLNADGRCASVAAYGYGLRWTKDCKGHVAVGHSGGLPGFGSNWAILPDYGIGIICFSNSTYAPASRINATVIDTLIAINKLQPAKVAVSKILVQRKSELLKLLPDWKNAESSGIFAENFFLDYFPDSLRKQSRAAFARAGKIHGVREMIAENNLRGLFLIDGENADIEVYFTLSPENPPLIQEFHIRSLPAKPKTDALLEQIFRNNANPLFQQIIQQPDKYRLQNLLKGQ